MEQEKINGGAFILARQITDSDIFRDRPAVWFKIWIFMLAKANHQTQKGYRRGQCFLKYDWIEEATHATPHQVKHCVEYLKNATMIATQKSTRGMLITILKYDYFQTLDNYYIEKSHTERKMEGKQKEHESHTINKNDKNDKNEKNTDTAEQAPQEIVKVIDSFKEVNPAYKKWFGNKTQRAAVSRMLSTSPLEKLLKITALLPKTNKMQYAPSIFTPLQLEDKMGQLATFLQKEKNKKPLII